jgi:putative membrane protein
MNAYIDYLSLPILVNAIIFFLIANFYKVKQNQEYFETQKVAYCIAGTIQVLCGLHMTFFWPLKSVFNIAYKEFTCYVF